MKHSLLPFNIVTLVQESGYLRLYKTTTLSILSPESRIRLSEGTPNISLEVEKRLDFLIRGGSKLVDLVYQEGYGYEIISMY